MDKPNFLLSALIWTTGVSAAFLLASLRYDAVAFHPIAVALGATSLVCLGSAAAMYRLPKRVSPLTKTALYALISIFFALAATIAAIGIDGILPDKKGTQSIGALACIYNVDLFALVIGTTRLACRRCFTLRASFN